MNRGLEILNNNDVISVIQIREGEFGSGNTLKIQQLLEEYKQHIYRSKGSNNSNAKIFDDCIECEVLRQNGEHKGWRKGKIKFIVQFEPDVIEGNKSSNALDDIRQQIDK